MSTTTKKAAPSRAKPKAATPAAPKPKPATPTPSKAATPADPKPTPAPPTSPLSGDAPAAATAAPSVVQSPRNVIAGPVLRKKELIDLVVERASVKKKDAKPVIDAMLEILGEALSDNRELNLAPMGKFKISTEKVLANGRVVRMKGRQSSPGPNVQKTDRDD